MTKNALQDFLNDKVIRIAPRLYLWRNTYYQCLPYQSILKSRKTRADHFVRHEYNGELYGIREMSKALLKKYYTEVLTII